MNEHRKPSAPSFGGWHPCSAPPPVQISRDLLSVISVPQTRAAATASQVLRARTFDYQWAGSGAASLKCVFCGAADYTAARTRRVVTPQSWLLLNQGQHYEVSACDRAGVEMFVVFFAPDLIRDAAWALRGNETGLLEHPDPGTGERPEFCERLLDADPALEGLVRALAQAVRAPDLAAADESLRTLAARLLRFEGIVTRECGRLSALRPATRRELMQRLLRARDFAHSCFGEPLLLSDLARVACLSPSHFLRSFRQAFGITPHQFIQSRRLDEARRLLQSSEIPVTEVCFQVGFESLGSFSALFRRRFGFAPSALRKSHFREAPASAELFD